LTIHWPNPRGCKPTRITLTGGSSSAGSTHAAIAPIAEFAATMFQRRSMTSAG
jgi:hypothetical protein